jgi:hypothetical protein
VITSPEEAISHAELIVTDPEIGDEQSTPLALLAKRKATININILLMIYYFLIFLNFKGTP